MGFSLGDEDDEDASLDVDAKSADGWVGDDDATGWGSWGDTGSGMTENSGGAASEQKEPEAQGLEATEAEASSPLKLQKQQQQQPDDLLGGPALTSELNGVVIGFSPPLLASFTRTCHSPKVAFWSTPDKCRCLSLRAGFAIVLDANLAMLQCSYFYFSRA